MTKKSITRGRQVSLFYYSRQNEKTMKVFTDGKYIHFDTVDQALKAHREYNYAQKNPGTKIDQIQEENISARDLSYYDLSGLTTYKCDFRGSKFLQTNLSGSWFTDCNFEDVGFIDTNLNDALFDRCIFDSITLRINRFLSTSFLQSSMVGVHFDCAIYEKCKFDQSDLSNAIFWEKHPVRISDCSFQQTNMFAVKFHKSTLIQCSFNHANLQGIDFTNSILKECTFTGAVYDKNTKWPEDFNPIDKEMIFNPTEEPIKHIKWKFQEKI